MKIGKRNPKWLKRSFRVSWGPHGQFAYGGDRAGIVTLGKIETGTERTKDAEMASLDIHLRACLKKTGSLLRNGKKEEDNDGQEDELVDALHEYMDSNAEPFTGSRLSHANHRYMVWSLLNALYGRTCATTTDHHSVRNKLEKYNRHGIIGDDMSKAYEGQENAIDWDNNNLFAVSTQSELRQKIIDQEALESFKKWLRDTLLKLDHGEDNASVGYHLSRQETAKACEKAIENGDLILATLLAQSESSIAFKEIMDEQVGNWVGAPINQSYMDTCRILSGDVSPETLNKQGGWLRAFATHVFQKQLPLSPITMAVESYCQEAWKKEGVDEGDATTQIPVPWYNNDDTSIVYNVVASNKDNEKLTRYNHGIDMVYHILRLACDNIKYPLRQVLDVAGHSMYPLHNGFPWHLNSVLKGLRVFGNCLSELEESKLCMSYIQELEVIGCWHWGVYIALFLPTEELRIECIRELVCRHIMDGDDEVNSMQDKLNFIRDTLGVPNIMIAEAQAFRYRYEGEVKYEIAFLAEARKWDRWHTVVMKFLIPKLISDGDENLLLNVLNAARGEGLDTSKHLNNWDIQGGLFELYANTKKTIRHHTIENLENLEDAFEELRQRLVLISSDETNKKQGLVVHSQSLAEIGAWVSTCLLSMGRGGAMLDLPIWEDRRKTLITQGVLDFLN